ncbi:MAG: IlvD/Edd family dehydratase [Geminicoccaceae bacterium]
MSDIKKPLRSTAWFGHPDRDGFLHRSWMKNQGFPADLFDGRPVIGICNTFSELTPCNAHFRELAERVKRGVYEAGGFPLEFPVFSTGESNLRPTAMLFRNLAAMDVEEAIRGNPIDGVVLMTGCDKTTPALLMGAASCDVPAIVLSGGPMLNGRYRGTEIGSGTDVWRFAEEVKAGEMSLEDFMDAEACMSRSAGHCMVMGTASTMNSMAEALGMSLPGCAAIPAVDSRRRVISQLTGRRIVEMVKEDLRISKILKRESFLNAVRANGALGGSTNAVIHLLAIAGRLEVDFALDDWQKYGHEVPTLVDIMPSGRFLMEDYYYAGGLPAVLRTLGEHGLLDKPALTVTGRSIWDNVRNATNWNTEVIRTFDNPHTEHGGIVVLRGNLAPGGAVLKPSAASPELMRHKGRAVVFATIEDYKARIGHASLDVDETCVLVLKNCGPKGYPGMAEVGNMGLPPKVLKKGVRDMVRVSDARMSGTAYGTVVLHVCPEAAAGGPLALVEDGDLIELDVEAGRLHLDVADAELARRRESWHPPAPAMASGYQKMYIDHVQQASEGADLDFLRGCRGAAIPRESH